MNAPRDLARAQTGARAFARLALPMAMLAAGLLVRDAVVSSDGAGLASSLPQAERASAAAATEHHDAPALTRAKPAATKLPAPAPAKHHKAHAKPAAHPAPKRVRPAKTRVGDQLSVRDHGPAVAYLQRE